MKINLKKITFQKFYFVFRIIKREMSLSTNKGKLNSKHSVATGGGITESESQKPNENKRLPSIKDVESELFAKRGNITPDDILRLTRYTRSNKE